MQSEIVKEKFKITCLEKYGVENPMQNEIIKEKTKDTCLEKYEVESPMQNKIIKEKQKDSCLEKYGVENPYQSETIKEKSKITCLKNYGVENPSQSDIIKKKIKITCLKKYGCENPMQNDVISDKYVNNSFKSKEYTYPSGNKIKLQGYEAFGLNDLLNIEHVEEQQIFNKRTEVPEIWWVDADNKKHRHYVDFYIKSENRCIEIKSTWTLKLNDPSVFLKQNAGKSAGYKYEVWVYAPDGKRLHTYI